MTPKAFAILAYLVDHAGRLVTPHELLEALWPGVFVQPEVLKTHVRDIRQALEDDARQPTYIETEPKRGYRFIATVHHDTHGEHVADSGGAAVESAPRASIAVLPFVNMSGHPEQEYFGDGLAEDIVNALTRIPGLKVIARTSAFAFRGAAQDVRQVADRLGVAHVLEGSVRMSGSHVRVTAQLIDASDGSHRWSVRYDRELTDVFTIQDEISRAIVDALKTAFDGVASWQPAPQPPPTPEAYQAYLEGRYWMYQVTPDAALRARDCYERAIRLDPAYAPPHGGLAHNVYYQALYLEARPREIVPDALSSLARGLQLDPLAADAHVTRAVFSAFYEFNWPAAGESFARALQLDPASARVHSSRSLWFLLPTGQFDEALAEVTRSVQLDPLNPALRNTEMWVLQAIGADAAVAKARAALELFSTRGLSNFLAAIVFASRGLHDDAAVALERGLQMLPGNPHLRGYLALVRRHQGRSADAERIRSELERLAERRYVPRLPLALTSEACGDIDGSYRWLAEAVGEREPLAVGLLIGQRSHRQNDRRCARLLGDMNLL